MACLDNQKSGGTILTSITGSTYKTDHFKHEFKDATRKSGLPEDLVFHGLRKTAAVIMAEAGCTTEQIKAITGHRTDSMAAYYARQANQKVLAKAAIKKVEAKQSTQTEEGAKLPNCLQENCPTFSSKNTKPLI
jgi:integrase